MSKKLSFILLFSCFLSYSQEVIPIIPDKEVALKVILISLEKEFEVRFSYAPDLISKFTCPPFDKEKSLKEKLDFLRKETDLLFEKIDKRYIIIKQKKTTTNQTICGFLVDKLSKLPIEKGTVIVENQSIGVSTDDKGYFELKGLQSDWTVRIDYLGYYSVKIPVFKMTNKSCKSIGLM